MADRDLGEMGEDTLKLWCSQVGITATKPGKDLHGWDYFLEFPLSTNTTQTRTLDKKPFPSRCFIQVKSTDKHLRKNNPIKLDNWLKLVKNPLPCFFLVLEFDGKYEPQQAFLIHIDEAYISLVLKNLRQIPPEEYEILHEKTMSFKYDETHSLISLNGTGLLDALNKYMGVPLEDYSKKKIDLFKNVGYEDGGWVMNSTIVIPPDKIDDPYEVLVDFLIGSTPHLNLGKVEINDFRFGILGEQQVFEEGGRLEVQKKSIGRGVVKLRNQVTYEELRIDTNVYIPQGLESNLLQKYFKIRFANEFMEFIVWPDHKSYWEFDYYLPSIDQNCNLNDLYMLTQLLLFLQKSINSQNEILIEMLLNSSPLVRGSMLPTITTKPINENLLRLAELLENIKFIVQYFNLTSITNVILQGLIEQGTAFKAIALILKTKDTPLQVVFWSNLEIAENDRLPFCIPYVTKLVLENYTLIIGVALLGDGKPTGKINDNGNEFHMPSIKTKVCRKHLYENGEIIPTLEEIKQSVIQEFEKEAHIIDIAT